MIQLQIAYIAQLQAAYNASVQRSALQPVAENAHLSQSSYADARHLGSIAGSMVGGSHGSMLRHAADGMVGAAPTVSPPASTPCPYTPMPGLGGHNGPWPAAAAGTAQITQQPRLPLTGAAGAEGVVIQHIVCQTFKRHDMNIIWFNQSRPFSTRPKYGVHLKKQHVLRLGWGYSVPCGCPDDGSMCYQSTVLHRGEPMGR